jgi:hypothetical protein
MCRRLFSIVLKRSLCCYCRSICSKNNYYYLNKGTFYFKLEKQATILESPPPEPSTVAPASPENTAGEEPAAE